VTETTTAAAVTANDDALSLPNRTDMLVPHANTTISLVAGLALPISPRTAPVFTPVPSATSTPVNKGKGKPTTVLNPPAIL
jgi:hypothetical protein